MSPEVGARLAEFRQYKGLTQRDAAREFGVSLNSWGRFENGPRAPNATLISRLAEAGLNINWLMTGEGLMTTHAVRESHLKYNQNKEGALSMEERAVLGMYRGLTKEKQAHAKAVLNALTSEQMKKPKTG